MSAALTFSKIAGHASLGPAVLGHVGPHAGGDVVVDRPDHVDVHAVRLHDVPTEVDQALGVAGFG